MLGKIKVSKYVVINENTNSLKNIIKFTGVFNLLYYFLHQ